MASTKEYLDFILEQLSELEEITYKAMMGEYNIYYRGKIVGGIYDDRFLVKNIKAAVDKMPDADLELPYEGVKRCCLLMMLIIRSFLEIFWKQCMMSFLSPRKRSEAEIHVEDKAIF